MIRFLAYGKIKVVSGEHAGKTGVVQNLHIADDKAHVKLEGHDELVMLYASDCEESK